MIDTGKRGNAYTAIYGHMMEALGEDMTVSSKAVKQSIMTAFYGSKAVPERVFGVESPQLAQFYKSLETLAPAAWKLNLLLQNLCDPQAAQVNWVLPDNFHVQIKVMDKVEEVVSFMGTKYTISHYVNMPKQHDKSLGANLVHSIDGFIVREMVRRCDYDVDQAIKVNYWLCNPCFTAKAIDSHKLGMVKKLQQCYLESGFMSARILDYITQDNIHLVDRGELIALLRSLPEKPFKLLTVHDSFRCLPNYGDALRVQYANQLKLLAKSNMLSYILTSLTGQPFTIGKADPTMWEKITPNYQLC